MPREHDVQDDDVELGRQGAPQAPLTVGLDGDHEAGFAEALPDEAGDAALVLYDQHAHELPPETDAVMLPADVRLM